MAAISKHADLSDQEKYYLASQWQLMWFKFRKHKLAIIGSSILILFYLMAIFADFLSPYTPDQAFTQFSFHQPMPIRFIDEQGKLQRPFVYNTVSKRDPITLELVHTEDRSIRYPLGFFAHATPYKILGIFKTDIHLFSVAEPGLIFLFGTDDIGRDIFTRTLYASRLSLSIGLVGVSLTFLMGMVLGGLSGYYGGVIDILVQRVIEFLISIPTIPLWLALSAALPRDWSVVRIYFGIVVILSLVGWGGLARVVRGKILELREQDYVLAARVAGVNEGTIIWIHLIPNFASYLIVHITLAIPEVILAETALSFLGLGLRSPAVSWGVLLQKSQNIHSVAIYWWTIIPALFVVFTVLAFNFVGDGLRDAADPYKQ